MTATPFTDLIRSGEWNKVALQISAIVGNSYLQDQRRKSESLIIVPGKQQVQVTNLETRRRVRICEKWIRIMRGDCRFGMIKTMDLLPAALRADLDGVDYEPPPGSWSSVETDQAFISDDERQSGTVVPLVKGKT